MKTQECPKCKENLIVILVDMDRATYSYKCKKCNKNYTMEKIENGKRI